MYPSSLGGPITSMLPNGPITGLLAGGAGSNPAALNIELDIPVAPYHSPNGDAMLRIWGLSLKDLGNSFDLNPDPKTGNPTTNVVINAGMAKGLPLATAAAGQAGPLVVGSVFQAFGNWTGTEQTLDIILAPAVGNMLSPVNYTLDWKANTTLATALQNCLQAALPKAKVTISISSRLTQTHDEPSVHGSLDELSKLVYELSKRIITDAGYPGVWISYDGVTVNVSDQTNPTKPKKIAFQDLIGQPTWIGPNVIQAKFVMRSDLDIQSVVTLPPGLVTTSQAALTAFTGMSNPANSLTFSGDYVVQEIHHYGNFRQPDAQSWNTTVNMIPQTTGVAK